MNMNKILGEIEIFRAGREVGFDYNDRLLLGILHRDNIGYYLETYEAYDKRPLVIGVDEI